MEANPLVSEQPTPSREVRFEPAQTAEPATVRVLLATDDSATARVGEEWIRRLRWAAPPLVDVLTVATRSSGVMGLGLQTYRPAVREAIREGREAELIRAQRIANTVGRRLQEADMAVQVWARHGATVDEILTMVEIERPDLVVVTPPGHSPHVPPWHRCVAWEVARRSERAVLVARPTDRSTRLPREVLIAADPSEEEGILRWMRSAGWLRGASMGFARQDQPMSSGSDDTAEQPMGILEQVRRSSADLVATTRSGRSRLGELAPRIATESAASVLIVPTEQHH